ncbi:MAG TPA: GNAT family N-acetyltransferase [Cellvibrio sp.]|nr:GNAT family N-acetyltransferase [Cellvibrio sp.]
MPIPLAEIIVQPLALAPQFCAQVAAWHHQECERQGLKSTLALRQQRLQLHIQGETIPQTLVAVLDEKIIGCVSLVNYHSSTQQKNNGTNLSPVWLSNLFVQEKHRKQGVGNVLIDHAVNYVRAMAMQELWLSAAEYTEFYQKRGWQISRRTRLGGRVVNIMRLTLTDIKQ